MLPANDPSLSSWINVDSDSDFPIQNIPFGVFQTEKKSARVATIIGDTVIDLAALAQLGYFNEIDSNLESSFSQSYINQFMGLGKKITNAVRNRISNIFEKNNPELRDNKEQQAQVLSKIHEVEMLLPVQVGDYTDFYSSREHATNVGTMFRDPENALLPNWLHLPVGYHGRASSIVVSGTNIHRPKGQQKPNDGPPVFGPSRLLDFELEMAFVVGQPTKLGQSISTAEAEDYIFGITLFNDWSARDIQKWEYIPLGPFLAKSFASTMSPWIVTLEALEPFRTEGYDQDPEVLPYLKYSGKKNYDIKLEVAIQPEDGQPHVVCKSNFKHMYWTMAQQLTHHTVNGCNVNVGDMCASGTISGPTPDSYGSMLEISWRGTKPVAMPDGSERKFINDKDTVIMRGWGIANGVRIGFGEASGKVLPAL
ncbi:MAG: fumarylacetoacetase [Aureispira sp.]|nr:fumarylacetoacetase [Aureispira sp.]